MALNIKKLEPLLHPTDEIDNDQIPINPTTTAFDGNHHNEELEGEQKRLALIKGFLKSIDKKKLAKGHKKKSLEKSIRKLNII